MPTVPLRAVFVGRLVPYKGADLLIRAAAPLIRAGQLHLTIVGDGPQRSALEELISQEDLSDRIELVGWVSHDLVHKYLGEADLLTFPSIREFGGGVVLEAMALGTVPMIVDYGGPADLVTTDEGFLIPLQDREEIVASLRSQLVAAISSPEAIMYKSMRCRKRAAEWFTWDAKARQVMEVYKWVLGMKERKPDWGMPFVGSFVNEV